jgi:hypothetical protein
LVLVADKSESLGAAEPEEGGGSGFITEIGGRKYLVTNAHVMAGNRSASLRLLDGTRLVLGKAMIAIGHDLLAISVSEAGAAIPAAESVETEAKVGDAVVALGNPGGHGVVTLAQGELVGIGPNRIEIIAPVEHGNSGGPIIHLASGKLIGVTTELRHDRLIKGGVKLRLFGYRLDSAHAWQAVEWSQFYAEAEAMGNIEKASAELKRAADEIQLASHLGGRRYAYDTPQIRTALESYFLAARQNPRNAESAATNLLRTLRSASDGGLASARAKLTYDYFRRQLDQEERGRRRFLDELEKRLLR